MTEKKRVLLVSEFSLLNTGFSVMNHDLLSTLHNSEEYEVAEFSSYVSDDDPRIKKLPWKVYPVIPSDSKKEEKAQYNQNYNTAQFGSNRFNSVVLDFKPDIVFSYRDYWHDEYITRSPYRDLFHYVWSACVDSEPQKSEWISTYSTVDTVTSYTKWGLNAIKRQGGDIVNTAHTDVMPGVDLNVFKPKDKKECRDRLGLMDDINIFLVVMRNQPRKLYPETNIWEVSRPILEDWLKDHKDPMNKASELANEASEVFKRLPDLPIIMDRANDVMTLIAEGKFNPNTLAYQSLREEELKLELMRNKILGGVLILVIFVLLVFK